MARKYLIYGLVDPRTDELRYIGRSSNGLERPRYHVWYVKCGNYPLTTRCQAWIKSLLNIDREPQFIVLEDFEIANDDILNSAEKRLIAHHRLCGCNLTNHTDGGEGSIGYKHTKESLDKISKSSKGRQARLGMKTSDVTKKRISKSQQGKTTSVETRRKMSNSHRGKKVSDETRRKMSEAAKLRWASKRIRQSLENS